MASETGREARDGYSLVSYDDGTFGWETDGGRSRAGYRSKGAASTQGKRARAAEVADLASEDPGHAQVDTMLEEIQQRVSAEYLRAYEEAQAKLDDYMDRFRAKDEIHRENVARGVETEADYRGWRRGQILMGNRWQEMVDTLAEDYRNADRVAASIVNGYAPDAYALNHDYATFQVERGSNLDTSYTLYSRATVERLLRDQPDLLPRAKVDGKKDLAWNRKHIASAITQGVLQGEDLRQVSKRVRSVADMDERAAMRTARTAMTSAQNAGRLDAYRRSAAMGIDVRKRWRSTLDGHTRHSHRRLDDEVVGLDEAFSNGLMYPGDPSGAGREVYNCRCTMVPYLPDYPADKVERASRLGDMSYEEWREGRRRPQPAQQGTTHRVVDGSDIVGTWKRRRGDFDFEIEDVLDAQGFDGNPRIVDADEFDEMVRQANGGQGFIAQRSYTGTSKEVADEYRRELYEGRWYVDCSTGGAQYGQGMYCAADYTGKLTDGIKAEMDHYTNIGNSRNPAKSWASFDAGRKKLEIQKALDRMGVSDDDRELVSYALYDAVWPGGLPDVGNIYDLVEEGYDLADKYGGIRKERAYLTRLREESVTHVETLTLDPSARIVTYSQAMAEKNADQAVLANTLKKTRTEQMISEGELGGPDADYVRWKLGLADDRPKSALTYDEEDLNEFVEYVSEDLTGYLSRSDELRELREMNIGSWAAAKGYDAINAEGHGDSGSYTVVLNRTKLIIKRPEGWR